MKLKAFTVYGWENGESYEAGKDADHFVTVSATNEEEAEKKGEKLLTLSHGKQEVIICG